MVSLNLGVSDLRNGVNVFEENVDGSVGGEERRRDPAIGLRTGRRRERWRLLYIFLKLYEVLGANVYLTTYLERGLSEYVAGFANMYMVGAPVKTGQSVERYRWLSMSLIFRASRPATTSE